MSQISSEPSVPCQRRSALPSPLKSAARTGVKDGPALYTQAVLATLVPFIVHRTTPPVVLLRHNRSALPSPSKSATSATCQPAATLKPLAPSSSPEPFMSQIACEPSVFCQRMSALPSPLKSAM